MIGRLVRAAVAIAIAAGVTVNALALAQEAGTGVDDAEIATAPVEFDGTVLFRVRGVSSLPAMIRARNIGDRLNAAASDPSRALESLRVVDEGGASRVVIDGMT